MKAIAIALCAASLSICQAAAAAKVDVKAAEKFFNDLDQARADSPKALSNDQALRAQSKKFDELASRANRLFGGSTAEPFGACVSAATYAQSAWQNQLGAMQSQKSGKSLSGYDVGNLHFNGYQAGKQATLCELAIESAQK